MPDLYESEAFLEAVREERETRQDAWLGIEEPLCGVDVQPLTLRMVLLLDLAQNWYVSGKPIAFGSLESADYLKEWAYNQAAFLWVVSPRFKPGDFKRRDKFFKTLRKIDVPSLHLAIDAYVARAFFDSPGGGPANHSAPMVDWIASVIHEFAASYSWGEQKILDTPLRQLLQLRRCIQMSNDPKARSRMGNPLSDRVTVEFLNNLDGRSN